MSISQFVHLRTRSLYSVAEGAIKIDQLLKKASMYSMPALSLTDNNNLFGSMEFSLESVRHGIQPIVGSILDISANKNEKHLANSKKDEYVQNDTTE